MSASHGTSIPHRDRFAAYCDGTLDAAEVAALEADVRKDSAALDALIDYMDVHAQLRWVNSARATATPAIPESLKPGAKTPTAPLSAAGVPMYRKGYEPQPFKIRPHHYALIAATLLAACGLAAYLLTASVDPKPDPVDPNQPGPAVATLIQSGSDGNLRTPHGYPAEGDSYGRGEYTLDSGTAEFMLTNSVNVKLRGSARMNMRNDMNVALTRGSASFVVPQGAKGFTVHLPDGAQIIDLGTAFTVRVDDEGRSLIAVTDGAVELVRGEHRLTLEAGQGTRLVDPDAAPQLTAAVIADDLAANPGFETVVDMTGRMPRNPGEWRAEGAQVVNAEQGITPYAGDRMLRILHTDVRGPSVFGGAEVYHMIDVRPYRELIDEGRLSIRAAVRFNRVAGDAQTDRKMILAAFAHRGSPASFDPNRGSLKGATVVTDADPLTWEPAEITAALPAHTEYLFLELLALEDVHNDKTGVELDGHYADGVEIELIVAPALPESEDVPIE